MHGDISHFKATEKRRKKHRETKSEKFGKKELNSNDIIQKNSYKFPKLKNSQLEEFKSETKTKLKKRQYKDIAIWVSIILIILILIYIFIL